jgi:hypothetical protein
MTQTKTPHWILENKVPLSVLLSVAIQTSTLVWWGARLDKRVENLEGEQVVQRAANNTAKIPERIATLEVQQKFTIEMVQEVGRDVKSLMNNNRRY